MDSRMVKFLHIRDSKGRPVGTIATKLDKEAHTVSFGAAACAPQDQYRKSMGRTIALGRLVKEAESIPVQDDEMKATTINRKVVEALLEAADEIPFRFRKALRRTMRDRYGVQIKSSTTTA